MPLVRAVQVVARHACQVVEPECRQVSNTDRLGENTNLFMSYTDLLLRQTAPNNHTGQEAGNVQSQMSTWIARDINFVGEKIRDMYIYTQC